MAEPRSFTSLLSLTAQQKADAARARQNPDATAEKPREAILDALGMVAEAIAQDGYAFSPSGPKFIRKCGDLTFQISIQSDRNNVAGQRAAVWVHVLVYSRALTAWRKNHSSEWIRPAAPFPHPAVATQLGYLCEPAGWVEWDFADKMKRRSIADDLTDAIRAGAYPLFETFGSPMEDIARLADRAWLASPEGILSYLLSTGRPELADQSLRRYLDKRPDFKANFERLHREFAECGLPNYRTAVAHDLAAFAVATDYPWSG